MREFSFRTRIDNIERLEREEFDLVIIGGGITGAGVARDAASRGMKVALVEAKDFAFGTSSRSSKLIHGGIRYLEQFEFHLVFEALSERRKLFNMAPNLVHPLRFLLPIYKEDRVGMFKMGLGMWAYDALGLFEAPELHDHLTPRETIDRVSFLRTSDLRGSYEYSDAYMDDDRLTIGTLRSASEQGAVAVNYTTVTGGQWANDKLTGLRCQDVLRQKDFQIKAKHVISTVGPWTDILGLELFKEWKKILRPSKGVHLTLERERFPLDRAIVMSGRKDKRIIFAIPRHEMVIVGTTDTDFSGDPSNVFTDNKDVDYLLEILRRYFPGANLERKDFISSYAGVRPLVADDASTESSTSREHVIMADPRNITLVAGGKYTTYRKMAEQTVNVALKSFPMTDRARFAKSDTEQPLNPLADVSNLTRARQYLDRWTKESTVGKGAVSLLIERHGMEAEEILSFDHGRPQSVWELEARFAIEKTMCVGLLDFFSRRTPFFLIRRDHGLGLAERIGAIFTEALGWDERELARQNDLVREQIRRELSWQ